MRHFYAYNYLFAAFAVFVVGTLGAASLCGRLIIALAGIVGAVGAVGVISGVAVLVGRLVVSFVGALGIALSVRIAALCASCCVIAVSVVVHFFSPHFCSYYLFIRNLYTSNFLLFQKNIIYSLIFQLFLPIEFSTP